MDAKNAPTGTWNTARTRFPTAPTRILVIVVGRQRNASHTEFLTLPWSAFHEVSVLGLVKAM
jgi:hypothetical protein